MPMMTSSSDRFSDWESTEFAVVGEPGAAGFQLPVNAT